MKKKILTIVLLFGVSAPAATLVGQYAQPSCPFKAKCREGTYFNKSTRQCECSIKIKCKEGFSQDPDNCFECKKCECPFKAKCMAGLVFNPCTCQCEQK